jgi:hypothetical protein
MSDHKLEKEFREKIDGHISPIDSDALWSDIQKKRGQEQPSRKKRIIWALLGLLLICGIYCTISNLDTDSNFSLNPNSTTNTNSISDSKINSTTNKSANNSKSLESNNSEKKNTISSKNEKSSLTQANDKTELLDQTLKSTSGTSIQAKQSYSTSPINFNNSDAHLNTQSIPISYLIQKDDITQDGSSFKINGTNSELNKTELNISKDDKAKIDKIEKTKHNKTGVNKKLIADNTSWLTKEIPFLEVDLMKNDIEQPSLKRIPAIANKRNSNFEIGASFNYEYAFRNLNSIANDSGGIGQAYADLRNDSEKFIESYRASLFLRHNFKHNFRASVGIEYAQLTERFDSNIFLGSEFRVDSTTSLAPIKIDSFRVRKIHNRNSSINIPIQIGKSFGKKRVSYFVDLGALVNISFEKSGQIFSNTEMNLEFLDLAESFEELQQDLIKISYMIHAGISYQLNDKTKFEIGPQFHSSFKPEFRINGIETSRSYLGLRFNLIRNF